MHKYLLLFCIVSLLTACDDKEQPDAQKPLTSETSSVHTTKSDKKQEDVKKSSLLNKENIKNHTTEQKPTRQEYIPINDSESLTFFYVALNNNKISNEEKLNLLSPEYYNEHDVFKKQDIAERELPLINKRISKYEGKRFIVLNIKNSSMKINDLFFSAPSLGHYDFEKKAFPLLLCGYNSYYNQIINKQNVVISINNDKCYFPVPDRTKAQQIESFISNNVFDMKSSGKIYLSVENTNNPIKASVDYFDMEISDKNRSFSYETSLK
ncbi:TPA: hypothetical protein PRQ40_003804 [Escherichia coli]|nr:hypothetical protein [Escherichia coli]HDJ8896015.1 hypothetical protein [Escherichia coli]HDJ8905188.1 hypothetical protein [Escherichia coli]HDJ8909525.1 hypothetical protein [Escherichia coli]HDK1132659.1 hypothetical protein [Escherichia coli]